MSSRTLRTLACNLLICALILSSAIVNSALAEDLTPQQAIQHLADSVALVKNYDVVVELKRTQTMKSETILRDGKRYGKRVPWPEGQSPKVDFSRTRQLMENGTNFRTEEYDVKNNDALTSITALNGDVRTTLHRNPQQFVGFIHKQNEKLDLRLVQSGRPYGTFYAYFIDVTPIAEVLGAHKGLRQASDSKTPELYVIEAEPESPDRTLGWLCLRVYLDPLNGYLPARIENYSRTFDRLSSRIEVTAYKALPVGIAVPAQVKVTEFVTSSTSDYVGQPEQEYEYKLDLEKSRWNCELDDGIFTVQFPAGTSVFDETKPRELNSRAPPPPPQAAAARRDGPN